MVDAFQEDRPQNNQKGRQATTDEAGEAETLPDLLDNQEDKGCQDRGKQHTLQPAKLAKVLSAGGDPLCKVIDTYPQNELENNRGPVKTESSAFGPRQPDTA